MIELDTYRRKRDFGRTPEPAGRKERSRKGALSFVVQKHAASNLHYDFRLEWKGVLLSWAVPKGPVPDPSVKRLAMRTEDHPLSYADFEGVIPEGEYGGGTVMVWDRGRWTPEGNPSTGLRKGRLDFELEGEKLAGRWTLVRSGKDGDRGRESWLLFKRSDDEAREGSGDAWLEERDLSVVTGRTMAEIAEDRQRVWSSTEKGGGKGAAAPTAGVVDPSGAPKARRADAPARVPPQLAKLVKRAPDGDDWLHEIKYDGYRLSCIVRESSAGGREVRMMTRNGKDWSDRFDRIARAASALPVEAAVLDGEAVVLDAAGRSDFQALQNSLGARPVAGGGRNLFFYAFDLLHLDGWNLARTPLEERKALLAAVLESAPGVLRYSDHVTGRGPAFHREACGLGLEGIVSKRSGTPYTPGRGGDWVKTKCVRRQEFVVVGWTEPEGSRTGLGSLVLGVHDDRGRLVYAGRVGTGFTNDDLRALRDRLGPLERKTAPVKGAPRSARGRTIHWVRPSLVAEVAFTEWTSDGAVRHPSFQGLREDKEPSEIVRETEEGDAASATERAGAGAPGEGDRADRGGSGGAGQGTPAPTRGDAAEVGGVVITSPGRVLYPDAGVTKEEVARYWESVADVALPLLVDRPLTLYRCPRGIGGKCFFQKHANDTVPETVRRVVVPEKSGEAKPEPYMMLDGLPALLTLVHLGALELHVWNARADRLDRPDTVVMDVDPGPGVPWEDVVRAAIALRDMLSELGLRSWPRGTGGKGLHVVVPLTRRSGWDEVSTFARGLSELMAAGAPDLFVSKAAKSLREGRIYVDYLRNVRNATAIGTFSPRARPGAPVAFPLSWKELEASREPPLLSVREAAEVDWKGRDAWHGFGEVRQSLTKGAREAVGSDPGR